MDEKLKMTPEEAKEVSGGYIFDSMGGFEDSDDDKHWELIDDKTGAVIERFATRGEAEAAASARGISAQKIGYIDLRRLRDAAKKNNN